MQDLASTHRKSKTYLRLSVSDILNSKSTSNSKDFLYFNCPIYFVAVVGIVVFKAVHEKFSVYRIDDGTGIISCKIWNDHDDQHQNAPRPLDISRPMQRLLEHIALELELGDLMYCQGRLNEYCNKVELNVTRYKKLSDPNEETIWKLEQVSLYKEVYGHENFIRINDVEKKGCTYEEDDVLHLSKEIDQLLLHKKLCSVNYVKLTNLIQDHLLEEDYEIMPELIEKLLSSLTVSTLTKINDQYHDVRQYRPLFVLLVDVLKKYHLSDESGMGMPKLLIYLHLKEKEICTDLKLSHLETLLAAAEDACNVVCSGNDRYIPV